MNVKQKMIEILKEKSLFGCFPIDLEQKIQYEYVSQTYSVNTKTMPLTVQIGQIASDKANANKVANFKEKLIEKYTEHTKSMGCYETFLLRLFYRVVFTRLYSKHNATKSLLIFSQVKLQTVESLKGYSIEIFEYLTDDLEENSEITVENKTTLQVLTELVSKYYSGKQFDTILNIIHKVENFVNDLIQNNSYTYTITEINNPFKILSFMLTTKILKPKIITAIEKQQLKLYTLLDNNEQLAQVVVFTEKIGEQTIYSFSAVDETHTAFISPTSEILKNFIYDKLKIPKTHIILQYKMPFSAEMDLTHAREKTFEEFLSSVFSEFLIIPKDFDFEKIDTENVELIVYVVDSN